MKTHPDEGLAKRPSDEAAECLVAEPQRSRGGTQVGTLSVMLIWLVVACVIAAVLLTVGGERRIRGQLQREAAHIGRAALVVLQPFLEANSERTGQEQSLLLAMQQLSTDLPDVSGLEITLNGRPAMKVGTKDDSGESYRTISADGRIEVDVWLAASAAFVPRLWNILAILASLGALFLLVSVFLIVMIGRLVGRPVRILETRASRLAKGELAPLSDGLIGGEFGMIGASLEAIREQMAEERSDHNRMDEELRRTNSLQRLMLRELNHRIRNNLAALSALVMLTRTNTTSVDEFARRIDRRIDAIAAIHALLSERHWTPVELQELLQRMTPPECGERVTLSGPREEISAAQATPLAMALQEMFANATEHGSLASGAGWLNVQWDVVYEADGEHVAITWRETGGPPPDPNAEAGTGTTLIRGLVEGELHGSVRLYHAPDGVSHRITIPRQPRIQDSGV
ncbi:MAG: hypothetical protein GY894_09060 [Planctomycetes bacterium]|nr:hypothetical protein [Planctomycetota bacterium]MCP4839492.1 hypothetical protein [Planctomycetota bacterium]